MAYKLQDVSAVEYSIINTGHLSQVSTCKSALANTWRGHEDGANDNVEGKPSEGEGGKGVSSSVALAVRRMGEHSSPGNEHDAWSLPVRLSEGSTARSAHWSWL